jgi:nitrous oxidase accessory protein NosD
LYENLAFGVNVTWGLNNCIWNNTFIGNNGAGGVYDINHAQALDDDPFLENHWNISGSPHGYGNYWSDWTGPDANINGIVDSPYNIAGSAGANDSYPLTTPQAPIPEFGMMPIVAMAFMAVIVLAGEKRRRKTR